MTITARPMDATGGEPTYTAQQVRQSRAASYGAGAGRALGGRSGFRPGTSGVLSATSTTWTLQPCAAQIDPGVSLYQGVYEWATDNIVTGPVDAANSVNPRKDIVYIQINDSSAGDGSGSLTAPVLYLAGAPAATPTAPTLPARSLLVGTITVPQAGAGSPSVAMNPSRVVSAGAPIPVTSGAVRAALTPYEGLEVLRLDRGGSKDIYIGGKWVDGDTGWVNLGFVSGFTTGGGATPQCRLLNGVVHFRGQAVDDDVSGLRAALTIPDGFRLTGPEIQFPVTGQTPATMSGVASSAGNISLYTSANTGAYRPIVGLHYPLG